MTTRSVVVYPDNLLESTKAETKKIAVHCVHRSAAALHVGARHFAR